MTAKLMLTLGAFTLAACATVVSETSGTVSVNGEAYELRTRVIEGAGGTFEQTDVIVGNLPFTCRPDSPGDCEAAVRYGKDRFDDR